MKKEGNRTKLTFRSVSVMRLFCVEVFPYHCFPEETFWCHICLSRPYRQELPPAIAGNSQLLMKVNQGSCMTSCSNDRSFESEGFISILEPWNEKDFLFWFLSCSNPSLCRPVCQYLSLCRCLRFTYWSSSSTGCCWNLGSTNFLFLRSCLRPSHWQISPHYWYPLHLQFLEYCILRCHHFSSPAQMFKPSFCSPPWRLSPFQSLALTNFSVMFSPGILWLLVLLLRSFWFFPPSFSSW